MPAAATVARPAGSGERSPKAREDTYGVHIVFGIAGAIGAATRYMRKEFLAGSATELHHMLKVPPGWKGRAVRIYAVLGTAPGGVATVILTLMVNGVATALTATITGTATTAEGGAAVVLEPGDDLDMRAVSSAGVAANLVVYLEIQER